MSNGYPNPGDRIGRFRIVSQLGAGGMGVVFSAVEENLGRNVALKVISPQFAHDPDFRDRFSREARALASLDSTHVVAVYAHGEEDGYLYIAAQLIPDGDLAQMIQRHGAAPTRQAVKLIEQVASGLADAHEVGLVHRDIKPGNVLIRRRADTLYAYLGDFGIARRVDADVTRVGGAAIGTPSYMAPELHSGVPAGTAADIYALGCLLWVTLTGKAPYTGNSEFQIISGHVHQPVPQLAGNSPLTHEVNRILRGAMAKDPRQRYQSAAQLRGDLQRAANLPHDGATPASSPYQVSQRTPTPTPAAGGVDPHARTQQGGNQMPGQFSGYQHPGGYAPSGGPALRKSRTALWVGLAAAAVLLVGGGGVVAATLGGEDGGTNDDNGTSAENFADGSAEDIILAAEKEMKVLDSVHVIGDFETDGEASTLDLTISSRGDCDGTMKIGEGSTELLGVGGKYWIRPDEKFWEQAVGEGADTVITLVGDRYVAVDEQDDIDTYAQLCDLDELLEGDEEGSGEKTYEKDGTEDVEGAEAIKLVGEEDGEEATSFVAADDPHYVLRLETADGSFDFSQFDEPLEVEAPAAEDVFDTDSLG